MKWHFAVSAVVIVFNLIAPAAHAACDPSDRAFVCGVDNAEDLARLAATPWIVASRFNLVISNGQRTFMPGSLTAIRVDTHEVQRLFPSPLAQVRWDRESFPDCSKPPENLSSHGLNVELLAQNTFRLYVVNHGGRESVEIVDVAVRSEGLLATWRGCLLAPAGSSPNSVVPLGGQKVAVSFDSGKGSSVWSRHRGWTQIAGAEEGDNGIEVSRDGQWLFLVAYAKKSVFRIPVEGGKGRTVLQTDFHPDNLRWGEDGYLYLSGFFDEGMKECADQPRPVCDIGFAIVRIDTGMLTTQEVFRTHGFKDAFGAATTALQIGESFWIGTAMGDRIAILQANR